MSTVLEKPVLLDETGQEIVDKLDEIKSAISSGGEYIPLAIRVTTPPTKISYYAGDSLDLSGIVVSLVGSNGSLIDVTSQCTFSPGNGTVLHASNTSIAITYHYAKDNIDFTTTQNISVVDYVAIEVTTPPTKTAYYDGDTLDLTGIVVKLVADDGTKVDVTSQCVFSPANGSTITMAGGGATENQSISITYHWTLENINFTTTQTISVTAVVATSIAVTTPPTKTSYNVGDTLDLTGIVVTATFNNETSANVTTSCTFSPANGSVLSSDIITTVNITYQSLSTTQAITVVPLVYGAEWDGTAATTWARTDAAALFTNPVAQKPNNEGTGWEGGSSPFDTVYPWKDIKRVTDPDVGELVEIPKYYYKWTRDGAKMKLQISATLRDGYEISPAHKDRGDGKGERDVVYVGRYVCGSPNPNGFKSLTNKSPWTQASRDTFRANIHNLGSDVWQWDYAMYWTIAMLYLVEFANWNVRSVIGQGHSGSNDSMEATGKTDPMTYHTGRTIKYESSYVTGHVQYRYIEDLWGNAKQFVDGIYIKNSIFAYCINNPSEFSDSTGGEEVTSAQSNYGYTSEWSEAEVSGFKYAMLPKTFGGSVSTYIPYYSQFSAGRNVFRIGNSVNDQSRGFFGIDGSCSSSQNDTETTSRLMKLP